MCTNMFNVTINTEKCLTLLGGKLLKAAEDGDNPQVENLLNKGASFTTDSVGTSALHLACRNGHASTAEFLMRAGLSANIRTKVDKTPLHFASQYGHLQVAQVLLQHGADINAKDMLQMTPLHWAVERKHFLLTKLLVENNAERNVENKFGKSPLDVAVEKCDLEFVDCLKSEVGEEAERNETPRDLMLPWLQTSSSSGMTPSSSSSVDQITSLDGSGGGVVTSSKLLDGSSMVMLTEAGKRILRCFNQPEESTTDKLNKMNRFLTNRNLTSQSLYDDVTSDDGDDDDGLMANGKRRKRRRHEAARTAGSCKRKRNLTDVTTSSDDDDEDDDVTIAGAAGMTSSLVRGSRDEMARWREQLNLLQQQFTSAAAADDSTA